MERNDVILVDKNDQQIGVMEKLQAHVEGKLHRAFSVFIFNNEGKLLLQQRALTKYHSGGLWTNTCCSHPKPGEEVHEGAHRRLVEEMGFNTEIEWVDHVLYKAAFGNGLIEHEYDHVFVGYYDGIIKPNPEEVESIRWIDIAELETWMKKKPSDFTAWFGLCLEKVKCYLNVKKQAIA
ncbi:isopentenyl-diphosphate Delta-isomerase [Flammeovirga sp. EKP202]|uniref:isopentenyl-diphosphate Delta-isomerase n=1 Tax=Flammeovirga sp. EKP202 TaxID=2770592 RepID=UPI00165F4956|nr:isopentenyl-diphosphate Delta-isomerase [Flammeovirga sp. EKP202]MBD0402685.1 isopentenyl-diphosphate Delta-isomerase [Flammeovirga sp. EKP202]